MEPFNFSRAADSGIGPIAECERVPFEPSIEVNPSTRSAESPTGLEVSTFDETPQQPFGKFTLKFRPGATAPLISPPACGSYAVQAELTPWSAPTEPRFLSSPPFRVSQGAHQGPCRSGDIPPFKPQVISGTQNNAGGSYGPIVSSKWRMKPATRPTTMITTTVHRGPPRARTPTITTPSRSHMTKS